MLSVVLPTNRPTALVAIPVATTHSNRCQARQRLVVRAEGKVVREYNEENDEVTLVSGSEQEPAGNPNSVYADELPQVSVVLLQIRVRASAPVRRMSLQPIDNDVSNTYVLYVLK